MYVKAEESWNSYRQIPNKIKRKITETKTLFYKSLELEKTTGNLENDLGYIKS